MRISISKKLGMQRAVQYLPVVLVSVYQQMNGMSHGVVLACQLALCLLSDELVANQNRSCVQTHFSDIMASTVATGWHF